MAVTTASPHREPAYPACQPWWPDNENTASNPAGAQAHSQNVSHTETTTCCHACRHGPTLCIPTCVELGKAYLTTLHHGRHACSEVSLPLPHPCLGPWACKGHGPQKLITGLPCLRKGHGGGGPLTGRADG